MGTKNRLIKKCEYKTVPYVRNVIAELFWLSNFCTAILHERIGKGTERTPHKNLLQNNRNKRKLKNMLCNGTTRPLPSEFQPGPFDVMCGRGKLCMLPESFHFPHFSLDGILFFLEFHFSWRLFCPCFSNARIGKPLLGFTHQGNVHMRALIEKYVNEYAQTDSKDAKSALVTRVLGEIKQTGGAFVKRQHANADTWYVISPAQAREKISQGFRELLHTQYKSSVDSRRILRQAKRLLCCRMEDEAAAPATVSAFASKSTNSKTRRASHPPSENVRSSSASAPPLAVEPIPYAAPDSSQMHDGNNNVAHMPPHRPSFLGIIDDDDFSLLEDLDMEWLDKTKDDDVLFAMDEYQHFAEL